MNVLVTIYYNVGGDILAAEKLQKKLTDLAISHNLISKEDNKTRLLSHAYFLSESYRTKKKNAKEFAKMAREIKHVDRVNVSTD